MAKRTSKKKAGGTNNPPQQSKGFVPQFNPPFHKLLERKPRKDEKIKP